MADLQYSTESYCAICDLYFVSKSQRGEHVSNSPKHPRCETCDRRFLNKNILRNHYSYSRYHHYCVSCQIHFRTANGLRIHIEYASVHCDDSDNDDLFPRSPKLSHRGKDQINPFKYPDEKQDGENSDDDSSWEHYDDCDFEDEEDLGDVPSNDLPDTLPSGKAQNESGPTLQFTCPICELVPRTVCCTPCGHLFCVPCIRQVYRQQGSCPICDKAGKAAQLRRIYLSV